MVRRPTARVGFNDIRPKRRWKALLQPVYQLDHIWRQRRLKAEGLSGERVAKGQPVRMQRLPGKVDPAQRFWPEDVPLLADERMPPKPRLQPNLIPLSRFEPNFDERRSAEKPRGRITADGFPGAGIACVRFLLDQRPFIPDDVIPPRPRRWIGMTIDDRQIDPLDLMPAELILQSFLRLAIHREDHQARCIAVDAVNGQGRALASRTKMRGQQFLDARRIALPRQRHGQESGRLVDNDQCVVFVNDLQLAGSAGAAPTLPGAARPIHPHPDTVASAEPASRIERRDLIVIDEDLAALERGQRAAARANAAVTGQQLVEPDARVVVRDQEREVAGGRYT